MSSVSNAQTFRISGGPVYSYMQAKYDPVSATPSDNWYIGQFPRYFEKAIIGWNASVGTDYLKKRRFFLSSDLGIVQNGSRGSESYQYDFGGLSDYELRTQFLFITANTLANIKLVNSEKISLSFGLGFQGNVLVKYELPDLINGLYSLYPIEDYLSPVSGDLVTRLGLNIHQKQFLFGFNFTYNYNAIPVLNARISSPYPDYVGDVNFTLKVNYISANLTFGYSLPEKKKGIKSNQAN